MAFVILVTSHCSAVPHDAQVSLSLGLIIIFREGYSIRPQQGFYEALGCGLDLCLPAVSTGGLFSKGVLCHLCLWKLRITTQSLSKDHIEPIGSGSGNYLFLLKQHI